MKYRLVLSFLICLFCFPAFSQTASKRCKWIKLTTTPFVLDTLTIVPGSITMAGAGAANFSFDYNPATDQFTLLPVNKPINKPDSLVTDSLAQVIHAVDSVLVCYRVLPLNLANTRYKRKLSRADSLFMREPFYTETLATKKEEIFSTPGLNKTGTVTRGISVGNRQNVFVNSALNLQLEGKLSDEINITAAITDQNIPFQPEGNTQQLQQFDRVYLTLQHRLWNITGGDVVLRNKQTHFLKFYKNVQGGVLEVNRGKTPGEGSSTTVAASVAKGKFASIAVPALEGVQGPYRLTGPTGEKFIIIIANSERVYLDGQLMTRGFDFDYIIDYNQAEITFTARHLITKFSRIRVDFEYSDRNYNRSIYHASHYQDIKKLRLNFNIYNEADNPNNLLGLNLNNQEKLLLQSIGDSLNQAFTSGAVASPYNRELILYRQTSELVNGVPTPVYIYSQDSSLSQYYTVQFTDVGPGQGDYIQQSTSINGRIFSYVAPVNGVRQGRYVPLRIIPAPVKRQMATLGGSYQVDKQTSVFFETAASEYDINRFSTKDREDDKGKAMRLGYTMEDKSVPVLGAYKLRSSFNYEYTDTNFQPIDRYRDIDFNRDWSLPINLNSRQSDNILNFAVGANKDVNNLIGYRFSHRHRNQELDGVQHFVHFNQQVRGVALKSDFFILNATARQGKSDWYRGNVDVNYPVHKLVPGYLYRFDKNRVNSIRRPDSLITSAMYFDEHTVYVRSQDTAATKYSLSYTYRQDRLPGERRLTPWENSQNYRGTLQTRLGQSQDINVIATYRQVSNRDSLNQSAILGTVNWFGDFLDRHLRSELSYSVGTGREPKRQYEFVVVAPGQGTHFLLEGSDPKNLNNYFEAQVPDARYRTHIKIFLPTDEYLVAYTNLFTYRLNSTLPRNWRGKGGLKDLASRFSAVTYININKKTTDADVWRRFNPFTLDIEDNLLISSSNAYRNTIFYNRSDPTFGLEYTFQKNQQKILLTNGTDVRNIGSSAVIGRYNLSQVLSSRVSINQFSRQSQSNYLTTKNFLILGYEAAPELSFQPNNSLRFTGTYRFTTKHNALNKETTEEAVFHELATETRISQVSKRTVSGNLSFIKVAYTGNENSAIGYEMLNALRPGNNVTWNFILQQRLSSGLNISVNYEGRKPNNIPVIHTGRMQVAVLF
ncbi:hypothetical protein [Adhaeribacter aquaticus]|uniref:hypothetical protein n=1 Tax=Adhaeribacter aquaticus TaxID=299567 RepID=UPI0004042DAE|nr:hypothetical protein [Adhaeribacter aquaticus]